MLVMLCDEKEGISMVETKTVQKKSNLVVPVFIGMGLGAFIGLLAYVKDWL